MTDLSHLKARVERAEGPDRELDCFLHVTLFRWKLAKIGPDYDGGNACEIYTPDGKPMEGFSYPPRGKLSAFYHVPPVFYTASVDAALALVERLLPGHTWRIDKSAKNVECAIWQWEDDAAIAVATAATAPLAILSALLTALPLSDKE